MIAVFRIKSRSHASLIGTMLASSVVASAALYGSAAVADVPEEPSIHSLTPAEVQSGALTIEQGQDGIRYVSGGVGVEERAWLAAQESKFNTRLTFAVEPGGAFVSDVRVEIRNAQGKMVLQTTTDGPKLLVALPAGAYQLDATHDAQTMHRAFTVVAGKHIALGFGFKN